MGPRERVGCGILICNTSRNWV